MIKNIITKFKSFKIKTVLSVLLVCSVIILAITLYQTYSKFRASNVGTITANTSGLICEISLDTNSEYVENNEAYFLINLQNYKDSLTNDVEIGYTLTITNQSGSNGLFRYLDSNNETNGDYVATLNIPEHTFGTTEDTETIKVYVVSESGSVDTVNFNVTLDAYQLTS